MIKRLLTLPIVAALALVACDDGGKTPLAPEAVALPETVVPSLSHVIPVTISGNPTCSELGQGEFELRIQPVEDGTYSDGTLTVTIDVRDTPDGQVFDFTSNIPIAALGAGSVIHCTVSPGSPASSTSAPSIGAWTGRPS